MKAPFLLGRIVFGGFFLYNYHLRESKTMAPYAQSKGAPELAVIFSGLALLFGGASLLLGIKPGLGAMAILGISREQFSDGEA